MGNDSYVDTIYGQILPFEWGKKNVESIMILVDGEEEYIVDPGKESKKLVDYVDHWITARGLITEGEYDMKIKIYSYNLEDDGLDYSTDDQW